MVFVRDRTNLFISYRQSYTHHPFTDQNESSTDAPLMDGEAIEMEEMPPQWLDITAQLDLALNQIRAKMVQLQPLHKKNALPGFDDRSATDKEIEVLTVAITRGLHRCQALVKGFGDISAAQTEEYLMRMAQNIQIAMAAKLQDCSTQFRQMQSFYLKSLQQDNLGELPGMIPDSVQPSIDDDVALSQKAIERGQQFQEQQQLQETTQLTYEDEEALSRERGISRVADTILEVAEIFRDLQTMVIDQGALIDRIDYNVENTLISVKGADKELTKGEHYQKRTQKCKIILLLVLIVVGLVLVLIFKPHRRHEVVYDHIPAPTPVPTQESSVKTAVKPSAGSNEKAGADPVAS